MIALPNGWSVLGGLEYCTYSKRSSDFTLLWVLTDLKMSFHLSVLLL